MLYYIITRPQEFTVSKFFNSPHWCPNEVRNAVRILHYEDLPSVASLPSGVFIFTGMEFLGPLQLERAVRFYQRVAAFPQNHVLNPPHLPLHIHALHRKLYREGINRFNSYRVTELPEKLNYPVFLRRVCEHTENYQLIESKAELNVAIEARVREHALSWDELLITEFLETRDADGYYIKFAAFNLGGFIVFVDPLISRKWVVRERQDIPDEIVEKAFQYCLDKTFEARVRELFDLANLTYGRIDFSLLDDKVQVWEINTNPNLPWGSLEGLDPVALRMAKLSQKSFLEGWKHIASFQSNPDTRVQILNHNLRVRAKGLLPLDAQIVVSDLLATLTKMRNFLQKRLTRRGR